MKKILIIEDEEPIRINLVELLQAEGFDSVAASDGFQGLQLARELSPDLVICDVMMPELDGYAVLFALRNDPETASLPFIFLTAKSERADLRIGMELGADDYLTKPFTRSELLNAIHGRFAKQAALVQRYTAQIMEVEKKLDHIIRYDSLTNLPNRKLFLQQLSQAVGEKDIGKQPAALLQIALDGFYRIADTLGIDTSDALLKLVAERLRNTVQTGIVARTETDQFSAILPAHPKQDARHVAEAIRNTLGLPFQLHSREIFITASIGISFHPAEGANMDTLIRNARVALYHARRSGGNQYQVYSHELMIELDSQITLEADLRRALERKQFELWYQPQVNLHTGLIVGAEALLRWSHPERGMVLPTEFIPLLEESGLIIPIGESIFRTACEQTRKWQLEGFPFLRVSVNLSGRQFIQKNFAGRIFQIIKSTGLNPANLELEITESILMKNVDASLIAMKELKSHGVQVSLDDFGTGYSSLSYVRKFPFDTLKIDQSFVRNVTLDTKNAAIIIAIIQMAHALNVRVTAEGVETTEELLFLSRIKCDAMQGYLYSRPLPAEDFASLLASGKRLTIPSD